MNKMSFKEYLEEYYKYFGSFSDVVDHKEHDDEEDVPAEEEDLASDGSKVKIGKQRRRKKAGHEDDEEEYNSTKFRQWMEISIAGD